MGRIREVLCFQSHTTARERKVITCVNLQTGRIGQHSQRAAAIGKHSSQLHTGGGGQHIVIIVTAGNDHSARIRKRLENAQNEQAKARKLAVEQKRHRERVAARKRRKARKSHLPLWKQRSMEREEGKTGTHADRRPMRD